MEPTPEIVDLVIMNVVGSIVNTIHGRFSEIADEEFKRLDTGQGVDGGELEAAVRRRMIEEF